MLSLGITTTQWSNTDRLERLLHDAHLALSEARMAGPYQMRMFSHEIYGKDEPPLLIVSLLSLICMRSFLVVTPPSSSFSQKFSKAPAHLKLMTSPIAPTGLSAIVAHTSPRPPVQ